jgi:Flp pilus assembly protein TadD
MPIRAAWLVIVAAVASFSACGKPVGPASGSVEPRAALREAANVGSQCADCHAEIVRHYARSGMSHSWRRVTPALAAAMRSSRNVVDRVSGYRYEAVDRGGELWQIETCSDEPMHRVERRAEYLVGSGNHAVAWVAAENGFLTELPIGWFAGAGWRMNPGYELKNHRFSRPIISGCVACHATTAVHDSPAANRFQSPIANGIDCSRCHGDAQEHMAFWKSPGAEQAPLAAQLVDPGQLAPDRANDVCLQCHLQGDVTVPLGHSSPFDFRAGQRLRDQRHDFLVAGQPESLGVASHGARMLQSRCYAASERKLTCIHCHDPHRPAADFDAAHYDAKCLACHQPQACNRPVADERQPSASGCLKCHMPQRPTREGIHLVFTDHAIRRLPTVTDATPPQVLAPNSPVELTSAWPATKPNAATLGAAYVLLHETMGPQLPSLARARDLLAEAVASNPADLDSRYWLGSALLALDRASAARDELTQVLAQQPERHEARYRLALAEEAAGNHTSAIAEYERLLSAAPDWPELYARLAQLYLSGQQPTVAMYALKRLVSLQPDAAALASLALAERLAGASHEQALATVSKALEVDPAQPAAYVTRGTLWLLKGQTNEARLDFERALRFDPANAAARQAIAALSGER